MVMIACVALSFWKHNSILDTISISSLTRGLYQVTALRRQGMLKLTIYKKNKLALLWGEAQLCLPYVHLKKEKNTIIKFIEGSSTHNVKTQNKKIKQE